MNTLKALLTSVAALTVIAGTASAHVGLKSSSIQEGENLAEAPEELQLTFTQPVGMVSFSLTTADGKTVETGFKPEKARRAEFRIPMQDLPAGSYVAGWRTVSKDGHAMQGSLKFDVK